MTEESAEKATYQDILKYLDYLRKKHKNLRTVNRILYGAKSWHNWLLHTGKREDHPRRFWRLRDANGQDIQLQDLFSSTELEKLMERKERCESVRIRNQELVSLLMYQGLGLKETEQVRLEDVDLEAGTVYSRGMAKTIPRTLKMKPKQIMFFYRYIHEIRPNVISENSDQLILNIRGKAIKG